MNDNARTRRPRWQRWLAEALLFLVIVLAIGLWQTRKVPAGMAPEFAALAIETKVTGEKTPPAVLSLSAWRARHDGRAVALYFWADWCPICKLNEGAIDAVGTDHPLLSIAMQSGDIAAIARHLDTRGLRWSAVADNSGEIAARYGLSGVPALIVLDPQGRIRFAEQGYTSEWGARWRLWWAGNVGGNRQP